MASQGAKQMGRIMCKRSQKRWSIPSLSSILHQNNRPNTSNLWLLTFFPFLFHTIFGRGSPVAWQMKEATPPCTPVWSLGVLKNFGGAVKEKSRRWKHKMVSGAHYAEINLTNQAVALESCTFQHMVVKRIDFQARFAGPNNRL